MMRMMTTTIPVQVRMIRMALAPKVLTIPEVKAMMGAKLPLIIIIIIIVTELHLVVIMAIMMTTIAMATRTGVNPIGRRARTIGGQRTQVAWRPLDTMAPVSNYPIFALPIKRRRHRVDRRPDEGLQGDNSSNSSNRNRSNINHNNLSNRDNIMQYRTT
jgi:hypothetical protein